MGAHWIYLVKWKIEKNASVLVSKNQKNHQKIDEDQKCSFDGADQ